MSGPDPFDFGERSSTPVARADTPPRRDGWFTRRSGGRFSTTSGRPGTEGPAGFDTPRPGVVAAGGPPVGWLAAALAAGIVAAVVAVLLGSLPWVALLCWAVAGPGAIGLLAVFVQRDAVARARTVHVRTPWLGTLATLAVVAVVAGIGCSAWRIADWWGRT